MQPREKGVQRSSQTEKENRVFKYNERGKLWDTIYGKLQML